MNRLQPAREDAHRKQLVRYREIFSRLYDVNYIVQAVVAYNHLVREGILQAVFCVIAFFVAISSLITFLFELTSLKDILMSRNITGVFLLMDFILALQYRDTIRKVMIKFQRGPKLYWELLHQILRIGSSISTSVHERTKVGPREREVLNSLYEILYWLNFVSLRIFSLQSRAEPISMSASMYILLVHQLGQDPSRPIDISKALLFVVARQAGELRDYSVLSTPQETMVRKEVEKTIDLLEDIERESVIGVPPMIDLITLAVIALFILFVIPLQIYSMVDILTPLLYPIIAIVFSSFFLFWIYYNEPFSPFSHYKAMDFHAWRRDNNDALRRCWKFLSQSLNTRVVLDSNDVDSVGLE